MLTASASTDELYPASLVQQIVACANTEGGAVHARLLARASEGKRLSLRAIKQSRLSLDLEACLIPITELISRSMYAPVRQGGDSRRIRLGQDFGAAGCRWCALPRKQLLYFQLALVPAAYAIQRTMLVISRFT